MSMRTRKLLATVALRQQWIDERLRVIERKLKITAPPAPVADMDLAEGGITTELGWIMSERAKALTNTRERAG